MARVLLLSGPLVVIVDAVSWQDYLGGVIQHHCSSGEANHAVLVTGFDQTGGCLPAVATSGPGTARSPMRQGFSACARRGVSWLLPLHL